MSNPSTKKYLNTIEFNAIVGEIVFDPSFVPMSQDTYNETEVARSIVATGKSEQLAMAAVNMSCVGYGNKKYGQFKYKDAVVEIATLLQNSGVKCNLGKDAKLNERDLTPQRLCRAFRGRIRAYLVETHFETYLYRKYAPDKPEMATICFRGSEYLDDLTEEQMQFLLDTYNTLDQVKGTQVADRVKRVFQAKGSLPRRVEV